MGENAEKIAANKAQKESPLTRLRKIAANKAQKEISIAVHFGAEKMNHNAKLDTEQNETSNAKSFPFSKGGKLCFNS